MKSIRERCAIRYSTIKIYYLRFKGIYINIVKSLAIRKKEHFSLFFMFSFFDSII